jgi:hypothetical protein
MRNQKKKKKKNSLSLYLSLSKTFSSQNKLKWKKPQIDLTKLIFLRLFVEEKKQHICGTARRIFCNGWTMGDSWTAIGSQVNDLLFAWLNNGCVMAPPLQTPCFSSLSIDWFSFLSIKFSVLHQTLLSTKHLEGIEIRFRNYSAKFIIVFYLI